jgi:hypothetical protein
MQMPLTFTPAATGPHHKEPTTMTSILERFALPPQNNVTPAPLGRFAQLQPGLQVPHLTAPQLVMVTPEWAAEALRINTINRRLKDAGVRKLCDDIRAGLWTVTHQGICFYTTGDICDGQHRLEAIKRAGVAVPVFVTYGFPREEAHAVDRGVTRSQADALTISGACGIVTSSQIALVKQTCAHHAVHSDANMAARLLQYREPYEFALDVFGGAIRKHLTTIPVMGAIALAHHAGVAETELNTFANVLLTGVMTKTHHQSIIKFRDALLNNGRVTGMAERDEVMRRTQNAILAHLERKTLTQVRAPKELIWPLFD